MCDFITFRIRGNQKFFFKPLTVFSTPRCPALPCWSCTIRHRKALGTTQSSLPPTLRNNRPLSISYSSPIVLSPDRYLSTIEQMFLFWSCMENNQSSWDTLVSAIRIYAVSGSRASSFGARLKASTCCIGCPARCCICTSKSWIRSHHLAIRGTNSIFCMVFLIALQSVITVICLPYSIGIGLAFLRQVKFLIRSYASSAVRLLSIYCKMQQVSMRRRRSAVTLLLIQ